MLPSTNDPQAYVLWRELPKIACTSCHQRHLACSGARPCQSCLRLDVPCGDEPKRKRQAEAWALLRSSQQPQVVPTPAVDGSHRRRRPAWARLGLSGSFKLAPANGRTPPLPPAGRATVLVAASAAAAAAALAADAGAERPMATPVMVVPAAAASGGAATVATSRPRGGISVQDLLCASDTEDASTTHSLAETGEGVWRRCLLAEEVHSTLASGPRLTVHAMRTFAGEQM